MSMDQGPKEIMFSLMEAEIVRERTEGNCRYSASPLLRSNSKFAFMMLGVLSYSVSQFGELHIYSPKELKIKTLNLSFRKD